MNLDILWAYDTLNKQKKKKIFLNKKKINKKPKKKKLSKNNLKQKELKWFVSNVGQQIIPSPMEDKIRTVLNTFDIEFHYEVSFEGFNPSNTTNGYLRFDFYIPSKKIAIEYDGKQFHKDLEVKKRDKLKYEFCKSNGIILIRLKSRNLPTLDKELFKLIFFNKLV